ncbi:uncharacterized protein LTR77_001071 [Saxophila tyrrhenica]|uniref:Uncharacterized protein n=1 Tax=Saxophila tyrrhenica TaxID=1690608 RepID=A0AAV9PNV1_9PEZI|nr:hypothetical protein LTR77_001071 [Saxophila tyrrhenica]
MGEESATDASFRKRYEDICDLRDEDRLDEFVEKAKELLRESHLPRYYRIRTLILTGSTVGNWHDAMRYWKDAENLWRFVRRRYPDGEEESIDRPMRAIREDLDELRTVLDEEKPTDEEEGDEAAQAKLEGIGADMDTKHAEDVARAAEESDDPEECLEADALVLGKTVEELRAVEAQKPFYTKASPLESQGGR